jgi:hypothetical protein
VGILLSFNYQDRWVAEAVRTNLFVHEPDLHLIYSPVSLGAVQFQQSMVNGVLEADAFLTVIGPSGSNYLVEAELEAALGHKTQNNDFAIALVAAAGTLAPRPTVPPQLSWIDLPVLTDRQALQKVIDVLKGARLAG